MQRIVFSSERVKKTFQSSDWGALSHAPLLRGRLDTNARSPLDGDAGVTLMRRDAARRPASRAVINPPRRVRHMAASYVVSPRHQHSRSDSVSRRRLRNAVSLSQGEARRARNEKGSMEIFFFHIFLVCLLLISAFRSKCGGGFDRSWFSTVPAVRSLRSGGLRTTVAVLNLRLVEETRSCLSELVLLCGQLMHQPSSQTAGVPGELS